MSSQKPQHRQPDGTEPYDLSGEDNLGALSEEQQTKLNSLKITKRVEDEAYIRDHPEISIIVSNFLVDCFKAKPSNVNHFASDYFSREDLPELIATQLVKQRDDLVIEDFLRHEYSSSNNNGGTAAATSST